MEINYVLSDYPTLLQNMVAKVYETTNPSAEVDSIIIYETDAGGTPVPGGGHNAKANIVFSGLDRVPHILRLFTASGTQLQQFNVQPFQELVKVYDPIFFRIGDGGANTPAVGDPSYVNTALEGLSNADLVIHRNGTLLYPGIHYNVNNAGGFDLEVTWDVFGEDEEYLIQQVPSSINTPVNDSVVGKQWGITTGTTEMFLDVTASVNYDATHLRKLIRISGAGAYHFDTLPPVGYPFRFTNMAGGAPTVYFDAAALLQPGGDVDSFVVPTGGVIEVVYDGSKFNLSINNTAAIGAMPYAVITHAGTAALGNIGAPPYNVSGVDSVFTIAIPDQGISSYRVFGSLVGLTADPNIDNDMSFDITQKTNTSFKVAVRKYGNVVTNVNFDYIVVKIN